MKRILSAITILSLVFGISAGAWAGSAGKDAGANGSAPKETEVTLSDTPASVKIGETVELTAITPKHGSSFSDQWDTAVKGSTEFDSITEAYQSKAVFQADKPGIYTIRYRIQMTAGNSNILFHNEVERTIEVINPVILAGAVIRDLNITPVYRNDGSISYYSANGRTYALWSDNSQTPAGSIFFNFGLNETSKTIRVTLSIDGKTYIYMVPVTRE